MRNNFEFLDSPVITDDYISFIEDVYNPTKENKGTGLRANFLLTSLLIGSSLVVNANDFNKNHVYETIACSQIENSKILSEDINTYIEKITHFSKNNINKSHLIENILSFKSLNNNWDGFGAIPLEVKSTTNALMLLDLVGEEVFCSVKDFYPNPNGTITFEWNNEQDESIFLEVGNNTFSYYVSLSSIETKYFNKQNVNEEDTKLLSSFIKSI